MSADSSLMWMAEVYPQIAIAIVIIAIAMSLTAFIIRMKSQSKRDDDSDKKDMSRSGTVITAGNGAVISAGGSETNQNAKNSSSRRPLNERDLVEVVAKLIDMFPRNGNGEPAPISCGVDSELYQRHEEKFDEIKKELQKQGLLLFEHQKTQEQQSRSLAEQRKSQHKIFKALAKLGKGQNEIMDYLTNGTGSDRPPSERVDIAETLEAEDTGEFYIGQ